MNTAERKEILKNRMLEMGLEAWLIESLLSQDVEEVEKSIKQLEEKQDRELRIQGVLDKYKQIHREILENENKYSSLLKEIEAVKEEKDVLINLNFTFHY